MLDASGSRRCQTRSRSLPIVNVVANDRSICPANSPWGVRDHRQMSSPPCPLGESEHGGDIPTGLWVRPRALAERDASHEGNPAQVLTAVGRSSGLLDEDVREGALDEEIRRPEYVHLETSATRQTPLRDILRLVA